MIENKKLIATFIGIEFVLYIIFMSLDIMGRESQVSNIIKFISMVLCVIMSFVIYIFYERFMDRIMLCIALSFTVFADIFLLFTDKYIIGVLAFIIVQTTYLARISIARSHMKRIEGRVYQRVRKYNAFYVFGSQFLLRIVCSCIILFIFYFVQLPLDLLLCATTFYFISFLANIIMVLRSLKRQNYFQGDIRLGLFLVGLILFFVCDLMVGGYNLSSYVELPNNIYLVLYQISSLGMWMFYLPGQVLITIS